MKFAPTIVTAAFAALAVAVAAGAAPATWREARAPEGGPVISLELTPGGATLYAGTLAGSIFRSGGRRTWRRSDLGDLRDAVVHDIEAATPTTAYAAGSLPSRLGSDVVLKTTDAGRTWRRVGAVVDDDDFVNDVAAVPGLPDVVYAASSLSGVYRSTDGGATWRSIDPGEETANAVVADPVSPETVYAAGADFLYVSTDRGERWRSAGDVGGSVFTLAVAATTPRTIYLGTHAGGVVKSVDDGATWRGASRGLPRKGNRYASIDDLALDPAVPNVVYAITESGTAVTSDGGRTWRTRSGRREPRIAEFVVDPNSARTVFAASVDRGVLRSTDRGQHWTRVNSHLPAVLPSAVAVDPRSANRVYLGTAGTGLVRTRNGGATWSRPSGSPAPTINAVVVDPKAPRNLYVATRERAVLKSRNGGATWRTAVRGLGRGSVGALVIDPRNSRTLYAGQGGIFKSVDRGDSWHRVGRRLSAVRAIAVDPSRPARVYAGTSYEGRARAGVYVSLDAARTWRVLGTRFGSRRYGADVNAIAVAKNGDVFATTSGAGVLRLKRGATRWTSLVAGLPRLPEVGLTPAGPIAIHPRSGVVHVGTRVGLYELVSAGSAPRWRLASGAFAARSVEALTFATDGSRLYAATPGRFFVSGRLDR